jgi:hypothetical protein
VAIAQIYQAGSIVLPKLGQISEITQSEIQAKNEDYSKYFSIHLSDSIVDDEENRSAHNHNL